MNVFVVRTRLQCLIAQKIISDVTSNEPYGVIFLYQKNRKEDAEEVYTIYNNIRKNATLSCDIISSNGILWNIAQALPIMTRAWLGNGICFISSIDSLPMVLALWVFRRIKIESFDDGSANLNPDNYYRSEPMQGRGLKRRLARFLFPRGHVEWMRERSRCHYTIFKNRPNIVSPERLKTLAWDWTALLDHADLERLDREKIQMIVLGTPYGELSNPEASRRVAKRLAETADLYIRHPREDAWLAGPKIRTFFSPAEAILIHLAQLNPIKVYHFGSTVAYSLGNTEGIKLCNLMDPGSNKLHFNA